MALSEFFQSEFGLRRRSYNEQTPEAELWVRPCRLLNHWSFSLL